MDTGLAAIVILITVAAVILFNVILYYGVTKGWGKGFGREIDLFRKAADRARSPWEQENKDLDELSRRVSALRGSPEQQPQEPAVLEKIMEMEAKQPEKNGHGEG